MNQIIIFPNESGGVSVLHPVSDCGLTLQQIATKDVPAGVPYRIIAAAQLPADRTFRDAWEAEFTTPDGYGGQA